MSTPLWLLEFQAFRAVVNQAKQSPESWDWKDIVEKFIDRMEKAIVM